ncbi:hypothetical protein D3C77_490790 [compost metagenome]
MNLDMTMLVPDNASSDAHSINPPKYLLYQDVLYGLFDKHVIPQVYAAHFKRCAEFFADCVSRNPEWQEIFQTQHALSSLLELKCEAGINIRMAYLNKDQELLAKYGQVVLPELKQRAQQFITDYHAQWLDENKIFGLDVFDLRMGGLLQRIETAIRRIESYLSGELTQLEELEQEILYFDGRENKEERKAMSANLWHTIATPSVIAGV